MTLLLEGEVGGKAKGVVCGELSALHQGLPCGLLATAEYLLEHPGVAPLEVGVARDAISANVEWGGGGLYPKERGNLIVSLPIHTINLLQLLHHVVAT